MTGEHPDTRDLILPAPLVLEKRPGSFKVEAGTEIQVRGFGRSAKALIAGITASGDGAMVVRQGAPGLDIGKPPPRLTREAERELERFTDEIKDPETAAQSYVILADEHDGVTVRAGGEAGLFHAAMTLSALIGPAGVIPCCRVKDRPALPHRAVLLDVSRGRVPTPAALCELVDLIAALKFNQLTMNIEHVFAAPAHPAIGRGRGPLAPADVKELDDYARDRFVELIPFQQSLGHLRGILSLPEYKSLAYDQELLWSLDPSNNDAYKLLADLYEAQITVTSSPRFHTGCDEPFDIIKRFDASRLGGRTPGAVIRDHLGRLHEILAGRGRRMMVWADAVVAHPEIIGDLPKDLVLCHWSYGTGALEGADHYRPALETIAKSGLDFYACTCSWSLMKLFPDLAVMRANHEGLAPEAKRLGAGGMMIAIWGDMGHMNLAGLESFPLALGARHAWEFKPRPGDADRAFSWTVFRDKEGDAAVLTHAADGVNRVLTGPAGMAGVGFLLFFSEPLQSFYTDATVADYRAAAESLLAEVRRARLALSRLEERDAPRRSLWLDHHPPILQTEALAKKLALIHDLRASWPASGGSGSAEFLQSAATRCEDVAQLIAGCLMLLESRWLCASRESDLEENRARYRRLIRAWRERAIELASYAEAATGGTAPPPLDRVAMTPPSGYVFNPVAEMGLAGLL